MTLEILVACRQSPERLVGATTPIAVIDIAASTRMWLWYPAERTSRLHREAELAGVVSITCAPRWADYALDYAKLIARRFDGIVAIAGEVDDDVDPLPLEDRAFAIAWRDLDHVAGVAVLHHEHATRRNQLLWQASAVWLGPTDPLDQTPVAG